MSTTKSAPASKASLCKPLDDLCSVCQRVMWGEVIRLAWGHWRHEDCCPGSRNWLESKPDHLRSDIDRLIANGR